MLCHLSVLDFCNVHYCLEGDSQAAEGTALYFEWSLVLLDRRKSFGKVLLFCMMSFQKKGDVLYMENKMLSNGSTRLKRSERHKIPLSKS